MIEKIIALLDGLNREELSSLPPARLRQVSDKFYQWHLLAETAVGGRPFPAVQRREQSKSADQIVKEARDDTTTKSGILSKLKDGERAE